MLRGWGGGGMREGEKIGRCMSQVPVTQVVTHRARRDVFLTSSSSPRLQSTSRSAPYWDYVVEKRQKYAFYSVETVRIKQYFTSTVSSSTAWEQTSTYCSAKRVENSARRHGKKIKRVIMFSCHVQNVCLCFKCMRQAFDVILIFSLPFQTEFARFKICKILQT